MDDTFQTFTGDSLEIMHGMESGKYKLIITSPPYNIGKKYEHRVNLDEYLRYQRDIIAEAVRLTADDGSICWQVGNYVHNGEIVPLDTVLFPIFREFGMKCRNRIIWHFRHGLHASKRFSGRHESVLWFTKSDKYVFNLDAVRIPSLYPQKKYYKGRRKGEISGNPLGKNPSDVWNIIADEFHDGIMDIPNVKHNHPEKTFHPCQFPVELAERFVLALTNEGDSVLDPYMGVGSSLIAAVKNGRIGHGIDRDASYVIEANDRLVRLGQGVLKLRPIGRQVFQPKKAA